ncbi:MAG TPA: hypothetical protein VGI46_00885, partial [Candidatus Acidoferrum sp.]
FLARIFGVGAIAGEAQRTAVKPWAVGQDHFGKGFAVAQARIRQYSALGGAEALGSLWLEVVCV